jgi:hypothetical protein
MRLDARFAVSAIVPGMWIPRLLRRAGSGLLAGAVLFVQLVTTAHACPLMTGAGTVARQAQLPCAGTPDDAGAPDAGMTGVCQQHCQFGTTQQPAEPMQLAALPVALPAPLFVLAPAPAASPEAPAWRVHDRERERAPPVALSVAHCCYRL